jgi:hypothetical protein
VRGLKYSNFVGHNPGVFAVSQVAMAQRKFALADTVLTQVGY